MRTSYLAPGVYVEEIPSAQRPITGVGTNTVGFIGIVPGKIVYPEPNPRYDPVAARHAANPQASSRKIIDNEIAAKRFQLEKARAELAAKEQERGEGERTLTALPPAIAALEGKAERSEDEEKQLQDRRRELAAAGKRADALEAAAKGLQDDVQGLENAIKGLEGEAPAEPAVGEVSELRPYVLAEFDVAVEPCVTKLCTNFTEFTSRFGQFSADTTDGKAMFPGHRALAHAVNGFFRNGGTRCFVARIDPDNIAGQLPRALEMFESIDELAIIAAPGLPQDRSTWDELVTFCERRETCFAVLDSPETVEDSEGKLDISQLDYSAGDELPSPNKNAAYYFPHIEVTDPARQLLDQDPSRNIEQKYQGRIVVPPSGHICGIYARTDEERGVHKAPANVTVLGALNVKYYVSKPKQELLNPQGVNCIRKVNGAVTVWGARTIGGSRNTEWMYVNVRRTFLFLVKSIDEGTQWIVFEPNDPALWGKIRLNITAFLTNIWRTGALFGTTPEEAFYVKCDAELNPPEVRDIGQVVTEIGVAIVRPAEFVIFRITQSTGQRQA
ncbi:phage tail sheath subtilisin-like domain-containing protein [Massilia sp. IC2-278]|uniref:phage tail sheath family protein n=1 Tax=Massilia sp. IC2-278 TaxID=2887200 RepID=UPI001E57B1D5|nr:phage tail sheath C-terminal domain-containing protein [Massilia sp. IC2-278]MCC2959346.1 phage tail sheath subtilisin-like domain-containing protein [Massilia sp. IC2-278]